MIPTRTASVAVAVALATAAAPPAAPGLAAQDASADYTEPYQRQAFEIYRTAIGFRTAAGHGQVPALARYLAGEFRAGGFPTEDVHVLPQTVPGGEETASLVVRYRGDGSSGLDPILLIAHMDVVDALPEDWERNPFTLIEEDGYFFGRGTLDDKFGVSTLTATFLRLKAAGWVPTRDLVLGFSGDEETGMLTTRALVTTHRGLTDAEFALNADAGGGSVGPAGEGIAYHIQTSEKTYATFDFTVRNPGGHSSMPRPDNAIYQLAEALRRLEAFRFPVRTTEATLRYFEESARVTGGELGEAMRRFADDPADAGAIEVLWAYPELVDTFERWSQRGGVRWPTADGGTRRSTRRGWWNWCGRAVARTNWPVSSSPRRRRSGAGWSWRTGMRVCARTI
ncbi:M20/M25/M40 family metallo-hydrolase [Candidatus Palauibacter sp.]|uniref:M20/M25/M40 family metallo-hydrolase n=1 Tax=Candidatus Palauibacter sp. TaxID=3101350 RepID=UPI003CC6CDB6